MHVTGRVLDVLRAVFRRASIIRDVARGKYPLLDGVAEWDDLIYRVHPDGTKTLIDQAHGNNILVTQSLDLVMGLLANEASYSGGILFMGFGSGDSAWDTTPVAPTRSDFPLVLESFRKAPDSIGYLVPGSLTPSATPTRKIEVRVTLEGADGPPSGINLREYALFGGDATSTINTGRQLNNVRHVAKFKDASIEFARSYRLELALP